MFAATRYRNPRFPFASNALKIWEVRNFPLDFLGQVRNIPRVEFSPAEKPLYRIPPPPGSPPLPAILFWPVPRGRNTRGSVPHLTA